MFLHVSFSLQDVLLRSEEELMSKQASERVTEGAASKPKRTIGKMKVQGIHFPNACKIIPFSHFLFARTSNRTADHSSC